MDIKIGFWNVLSLYRLGGLQALLDQIDKYNIDLAAIQEIRWTGEGVLEKRHHTIYYSCHEKKHIFGTGFVVKGKLRDRVIGFHPVNPRICRLRIKGKFYNFSLISCHAPTEAASDDEKDEFFDKLERSFDNCPKSDIKIILGDFNAQIGREECHKPTIGMHSLHEESNDNGLRLISLATSRGLVVGSTLFPGKRIHKATWKSPDGSTCNQIDHILISARHRSNLMSTRTFRGANVDSDHYLSIANIRARISRAKRTQTSKVTRFNVSRLKSEDVLTAYRNQLEANLAENTRGTDNTVESTWDSCQRAVKKTAEESLGLVERMVRSPWFDD